MLWIGVISLIVNAWTPFMFHINTSENNQQYCDINEKFKYEYFIFNSIYMLIVILAPSILISVLNVFIIRKMFQNEQQRKKLFEDSKKNLNDQIEMSDLKKNQKTRKNSFKLNECYLIGSTNRKFRIKPFYWTSDQFRNKNKQKKSKRNLSLCFKLCLLCIYSIKYLFILNNLNS